MDQALLRDRELFKKKALNTPTVEKKKRDLHEKTATGKEDNSKKKFKTTTDSTASSSSGSNTASYKTVIGSNNDLKFLILAKIVKYMKNRHQEGEDHPLSLEEILDETNQPLVSPKIKDWLENEALVGNPKIEVTENKKFIFKPPYKIKDKKSLLKLLKHHDLKGLGGIMLEDVHESLPHSEKVLKQLQNEIIYIQRSADKKKILFYNDRSISCEVDEEFKKLWRSINVDNLDDDKIQDYLEKQGIKSFQGCSVRKVASIPAKKKRGGKPRISNKPRDNEHIAHVLETYDNMDN